MQEASDGSPLVSRPLLEKVVEQLTKDESGLAQQSLHVLSSGEMPRWRWNSNKKIFVGGERGGGAHFGSADDRLAMMRERYHLIHQRCMRNRLFRPPVLRNGTTGTDVFELTPIESLTGVTGSRYVLGMLTVPEEGVYHLEDLTASVRLDLSAALMTSGLFTENSFVIAEGTMDHSAPPLGPKFIVNVLGFPPPETRAETLQALRHVDLFGAAPAATDFNDLLAMEREAEEEALLVLSDVWLDNDRVMRWLAQILTGYQEMGAPPRAIVLMGNFSSKPLSHDRGGPARLISLLDGLADLICAHEDILANTEFLLVPGPHDPAASKAFPRPPLPPYLTEAFVRRVPRAKFTSNPVRLRYYTQSILIFRHDLLQQMRRNVVLAPNLAETDDMSEHLVKTIMDQSHLVPMPLDAVPISWANDHALRVYPLPHLLILGDSTSQFTWQYEDAKAFNPTSFHQDGSFVTYFPATQVVEYSNVNGDDEEDDDEEEMEVSTVDEDEPEQETEEQETEVPDAGTETEMPDAGTETEMPEADEEDTERPSDA